MIKNFSEIWVPDLPLHPGLAGKLSHPDLSLQQPLHYIGPLSRFSFQPPAHPTFCKLLILISGPEPQRTIFEENILKELPLLGEGVFVVLGNPNSNKILPRNVFNHLPSGKLAALIVGAENIIARAGYSTVMDLIALGKTALLVPTPGQGEQEYIASHLSSAGYFTALPQPDFTIKKSQEILNNFKPEAPPLATKPGERIRQFVAGLKAQL